MIWPAQWTAVGTVEDVLAEIVEWFEAGAMDGFVALPGGSLDSLTLFLDELVPRLDARGLFREEYEGSTLRSHLGLDCAAFASSISESGRLASGPAAAQDTSLFPARGTDSCTIVPVQERTAFRSGR